MEDAAHPNLAKQIRTCFALSANPSPPCQVKENVKPADLIRQANLEQDIQPAWSQKRVFNHIPTIHRSDDENVSQLIDAIENWLTSNRDVPAIIEPQMSRRVFWWVRLHTLSTAPVGTVCSISPSPSGTTRSLSECTRQHQRP
ncbi:hypothetical protein CDEST_15248 [Colletotrichum destructivum]|uniref:Uncharacterized protein n=1 Tax=Colletotrichum destructivum TaxID=34406 RepID=A0AAX4J3U2_9PEZI|nr:hypothetical protein CDEST_15248 [Colletotrichum destructivum]